MKLMISFMLLGLAFFAAPTEVVAANGDAQANESGMNHSNDARAIFCGTRSVFTGNMGTLAGLAISLFGLYIFLVQQSSWGIAILIMGLAVTAYPGFFESFMGGYANVWSDVESDHKKRVTDTLGKPGEAGEIGC